MKLLTKKLETLFTSTGNQEDVKNPLVIAKFFNPCGLGTWYATEYNPETRIFFGYVSLFENEWGYFSLDELESVRLTFGLGIERDIHFSPIRFNDLSKTQGFGK